MIKAFSVLILLFTSFSCKANELIFLPSFSLSERYDDNLRLRRNPPNINFISKFSPAVKLGLLRENGLLETDLRLNQLIYHNEPALDATEKIFNGVYSYSDDLFSFSINGNYSIQSTITTELGPAGSGFLGNVNVFRTSQLLSPNFTFNLTEKNAIQLGYSYNDISYERNTQAVRLIDFTNQQFSAVASHKISNRQSINLTGNYSLFSAPEANQTSTTVNFELGWQYLLSEQTQLKVSVGRRTTNSEFLNSLNTRTTSGQTFSINLDKELEWGSINLSAKQQLNPASTGQQQQSTILNAGVSYNLSERFSTNFSANYLKLQSTSVSTVNSNLNRTLTTLSPSISWRWTPDLKLEFSYSYRQQIIENQGNNNADGNSIQFQLSYQPQVNRQVK